MTPAPSFDACIALDWSGAGGRRYAGIAIAELAADASTPRLVPPPDGRSWTRTDAVAWLQARCVTGRALVGIDCAFSLPETTIEARHLWSAIDAACADVEDFHGAHYASRAEIADRYWTSGTMPGGWIDRHRRTEIACRDAGCGAPQSPYKLIGPRQVGKAALAGMRVLHALTTAPDPRFTVWPFTPPSPDRSVLVEIYPRLFLRRCGHGSAKVRSTAELNACLAWFGCAPARVGGKLDDHAADALVSAAGLRILAKDASLWAPRIAPELLAREGWIFGVPA